MEVYILIDNQPQGPYTRELVQRYLKSGQLKATDLAAYAGSSDWQPLSVMMRSWGGSRRPTLRSANSIAGIVTVLVLALVVGWVVVRLLRHLPDSVVKDSPKAETNTAPQIEDDGYPKTLAELNKWYVEPPEGQNAATYFLQGGAAIQVTNEDYESQSLPLFGRSQFPAPPLVLNQRRAITEFVQKNEPAWKLLHEGVRFEGARYPIDLTQGWGFSFSHFVKVRNAAELGILRTVLSAANKQPQQAVDAFLLSLAVVQSLREEPLTASQLTREGRIQVQRSGLEFMFNAVAVPSADLDRLAAALAKVEAKDSKGVPFTRALAGERVLTLHEFESPDKLKKEIEELQRSGFAGWTNATMNQLMTNLPAQCAFMIETLTHELALRKEPFPERLKSEEYTKSRTAEAKSEQFYLAEAMLTGRAYSVRREATGLAYVRVMQTAVALEQFRRVNRKYPDSLSELVPKFLPAVPADPFNGEPLFYLKAAGYEVNCRGAVGAPIQFRVETPAKL